MKIKRKRQVIKTTKDFEIVLVGGDTLEINFLTRWTFLPGDTLNFAFSGGITYHEDVQGSKLPGD